MKALKHWDEWDLEEEENTEVAASGAASKEKMVPCLPHGSTDRTDSQIARSNRIREANAAQRAKAAAAPAREKKTSAWMMGVISGAASKDENVPEASTAAASGAASKDVPGAPTAAASGAASKAEATPKAAAPKADAIPNLPNSVEAGAGWPAEAASKAGAKPPSPKAKAIAPAPSPAPQAAPEASRGAPTEAMDEWQALNSMTALAASSHSSMQRMEADRLLIYPIREGHPPIVQIRADAERCSDCSVFGLFSAQCSEHLKACLVAEPDARYLVPGT